MPDLFPNLTTFVLCGLVVAGAQLIYATVGFGAGMFSIALLALLLPDLAQAVATLLLLTFVTEAYVLIHAWRQARIRLLLGLLPMTAVGMWLGTELLVAGNVSRLKCALGVVIAAAGAWFLYTESRAKRQGSTSPGREECRQDRPNATKEIPDSFARLWTSLPAGLASGTLAGLFGTGGPPVIIFLKAHGLNKGAFRATLLWYFLLVSFLRAAGYMRAGILTTDELTAALWLLPPSLAGMLLGMALHRRVPERGFQTSVSVLLILLGGLLALGGGR